MLSVGSADGAAGWSLPLPLPTGRELSPSLTLSYSSGGGNDAFGAGWHCPLPAVSRMSRFGIPRYNDDDRLAGPDGEEILRDKAGVRIERSLPFSTVIAEYTVTPWVSRSAAAGASRTLAAQRKPRFTRLLAQLPCRRQHHLVRLVGQRPIERSAGPFAGGWLVRRRNGQRQGRALGLHLSP